MGVDFIFKILIIEIALIVRTSVREDINFTSIKI